jgi:hypothetical protein
MYYCYRFINKIQDTKRWIVNSYQRIKYGIGNDDMYNLGYHLAKIISYSLQGRFYTKNIGIPMAIICDIAKIRGIHPMDYKIEDREASNKWDEIITEIREGFEAYMRLDMWIEDKKEEKLLHDKFLKGLELFKKYYESLWI